MQTILYKNGLPQCMSCKCTFGNSTRDKQRKDFKADKTWHVKVFKKRATNVLCNDCFTIKTSLLDIGDGVWTIDQHRNR